MGTSILGVYHTHRANKRNTASSHSSTSRSSRRSSAGTTFTSGSTNELRRDFYRVEELAKKKGVSMAQISMAWILGKPGVTAPIVGTTSLKNLEDILGKS